MYNLCVDEYHNDYSDDKHSAYRPINEQHYLRYIYYIGIYEFKIT